MAAVTTNTTAAAAVAVAMSTTLLLMMCLSVTISGCSGTVGIVVAARGVEGDLTATDSDPPLRPPPPLHRAPADRPRRQLRTIEVNTTLLAAVVRATIQLLPDDSAHTPDGGSIEPVGVLVLPPPSDSLRAAVAFESNVTAARLSVLGTVSNVNRALAAIRYVVVARQTSALTPLTSHHPQPTTTASATHSSNTAGDSVLAVVTVEDVSNGVRLQRYSVDPRAAFRPNRAPVPLMPAATLVIEADAEAFLTLPPHVYEPDGDALTFAVAHGSFCSVPRPGLLVCRPQSASVTVGEHEVLVTASDPFGASADMAIRVRVDESRISALRRDVAFGAAITAVAVLIIACVPVLWTSAPAIYNTACVRRYHWPRPPPALIAGSPFVPEVPPRQNPTTANEDSPRGHVGQAQPPAVPPTPCELRAARPARPGGRANGPAKNNIDKPLRVPSGSTLEVTVALNDGDSASQVFPLPAQVTGDTATERAPSCIRALLKCLPIPRKSTLRGRGSLARLSAPPPWLTWSPHTGELQLLPELLPLAPLSSLVATTAAVRSPRSTAPFEEEAEGSPKVNPAREWDVLVRLVDPRGYYVFETVLAGRDLRALEGAASLAASPVVGGGPEATRDFPASRAADLTLLARLERQATKVRARERALERTIRHLAGYPPTAASLSDQQGASSPAPLRSVVAMAAPPTVDDNDPNSWSPFTFGSPFKDGLVQQGLVQRHHQQQQQQPLSHCGSGCLTGWQSADFSAADVPDLVLPLAARRPRPSVVQALVTAATELPDAPLPPTVGGAQQSLSSPTSAVGSDHGDDGEPTFGHMVSSEFEADPPTVHDDDDEDAAA